MPETRSFRLAVLTLALCAGAMPAASQSASSTIAWSANTADDVVSYTDPWADSDGDSVSNWDEYLNGTDPNIRNTWILAEGSTGFFRNRFAIVNPATDRAEITVTFLREGTTSISQEYSVAAMSRLTISSGDATVNVTVLREGSLLPLMVGKTVKAHSRLTMNSTELALNSGEKFGAVVESTNGVPIAVERALYWDGAGKHWGPGTSETGILLK